MAVVARIICYSWSRLGSGQCSGLPLSLSDHDRNAFSLLLACVGAMVGAVAGATGEIVTAQRRLTKPEPLERMSKTFDTLD